MARTFCLWSESCSAEVA